jgi:hypothetical protein
MIFGISKVNAYLIYKENYDTSRMMVLEFHESLVQSLLPGMALENQKPSPRELSTSQRKRKLADHKLEERKGSDRGIRRRYVGYYEKKREQQSKEACRATRKRIKTFCSDCNTFFCFDCFNGEHHAMK